MRTQGMFYGNSSRAARLAESLRNEIVPFDKKNLSIIYRELCPYSAGWTHVLHGASITWYRKDFSLKLYIQGNSEWKFEIVKRCKIGPKTKRIDVAHDDAVSTVRKFLKSPSLKISDVLQTRECEV